MQLGVLYRVRSINTAGHQFNISSADSVKRSDTETSSFKLLILSGTQTAAAVSEEITSHKEASIITTCPKK